MNWADLRRRPAVAATSIARRQGIRRKYHGLEIQRFLFGAWTLGVFGFLYVPILLLVAFSFNSSRLNIRWGGFSLKWYGALLQNSVLLEAFKNSRSSPPRRPCLRPCWEQSARGCFTATGSLSSA